MKSPEELIQPETLLERIRQLGIADELRERLVRWVRVTADELIESP